jgi:hypothetical protein
MRLINATATQVDACASIGFAILCVESVARLLIYRRWNGLIREEAAMSLIHRKPSPPKSAAAPSDPTRNLTPFGPDNPSPAPFLPGHRGLKNGRVQRSRADLIRKFLECTKRSAKDEYGRTRIEQMVANMVEIAKSPKHPQAVAAFIAVCDRGYGRPKPSEEETDAIAKAKSGIVLVYVDRAQIDPDIPIVEPLPESCVLPPEFEDDGDGSGWKRAR